MRTGTRLGSSALIAAAIAAAIGMPLGPARAAARMAPATGAATIDVRNPIAEARPSETIGVPLQELRRALAFDDTRRLHVVDPRDGRELLAQVIDVSGETPIAELVFQADLAAGETHRFEVRAGEPRAYRREDFHVYGRFVRERFDDFAWENDRVAFRTYGKALETWVEEPLTSSAIDVWSKRTRRLVVNDWYMVDDYHRDTGEGADLYSAGRTRGCGGSGIWSGGRLYTSANFIDSRVLANGPIRLVFELTYPAWDAGGARVSEVKRVTLDAGTHLNRFESYYRVEGGGNGLVHAAGIRKAEGASVTSDRSQGLLRSWEPVQDGKQGHLGCGVLMPPATIAGFAEDSGNRLITSEVRAGAPSVWHAGFAWDRDGEVADAAAWDAWLAGAARRIQSPPEVRVASR